MANQLVRYELGKRDLPIHADHGQLTIGDSTPATTSTSMFGVAADASGNLLIADSANSCIYKVSESGFIKLFAGTPDAEGSNNGIASVARFNNPHGVAVDGSGVVWVADTGNGAIRRIDLNGNVGTVADGFIAPWGIACAANGDVYFTDKDDHCVYRIRGSEVIALAGDPGNAGDISAEYANNALFDSPTGIAVDPSGYVFVADSGNNKIKRIGLDGFVVRYCGTATSGDVIGTYQTSRFTSLGLMACDKSGDIYVIDSIYANTASSSSSGSEENGAGLAGDKVKKIDKNGNSSLISIVAGGSVVGIATTPSGVVYVTRSSGLSPNSSSSQSSSSDSSDSSTSESSGSSESTAGV